MANINIYEQDNTLLGGVTENRNIVYIPGFAATNTNVYIVNTSGTEPTENTYGSVVTDVDLTKLPAAYNEKHIDLNAHALAGAACQYYCNTADQKLWVCTAETSGAVPTYTWTLQNTYIAPYPENKSILCSSISEFENNFGSEAVDLVSTSVSALDFSVNAFAATTKISSKDISYIIARELISLGLPVLYENIVTRTAGKKDIVTPQSLVEDQTWKYQPSVIYDAMAGATSIFAKLNDISDYQVKFITSGGYPVFEHYTGSTYNDIAANMIAAAAGKGDENGSGRGDAFALIDHTNYPERALTGSTSVYEVIQSGNYKLDSSYAAMFTPWFKYTTTSLKSNVTVDMPGSFAYLRCLATSINFNPDWLAVAGVTRGSLGGNFKGANTTNSLTNSIANAYQKDTGISINPITNIRPYGDTIWGNRTLRDNSAGMKALSFLNLRSLMCDLKKQAYEVATSLMFEQNNDVLWVNFLAGITPLLDQMKSSSGISGYKIYNNSVANSKKLSALIKLFPVYAVEDFDIYISLENNEVIVE